MKKRIFRILAALCALCSVACLVLYLLPQEGSGVPVYSGEKQTGDDKNKEPEPQEKEPYVSPVDFAALQQRNPDIYAWITVPNTHIDYPVVQNTDDSFYLRRNSDRNYYVGGSIFSESAYNQKDFSDSITVLYGHRMQGDVMFGGVQARYSTPEALEQYGEIVIYLPEKEQHYQVFAAVPYDNRHIMYQYAGEYGRGTRSFLSTLKEVRALDAVIDEENFASAKDQILVLSTCLQGDRNRRFIVVAKLVSEIPS